MFRAILESICFGTSNGRYHTKKWNENTNNSHRWRGDSIEVLAANARGRDELRVIVTECPGAGIGMRHFSERRGWNLPKAKGV